MPITAAVESPRLTWLERWLETCADLADLRASNPMMDAVIDEIDGRMIRVGDQWLADFASCNYLGFDLEPEIIDAVPPALAAWGTHPSWSRLLGSPVLYEQIEDAAHRAARVRGLAAPADDHAHPRLGDSGARRLAGTIFLDARAHKTIYDGCQVARGARRDRQAVPIRGRPTHLEQLLRQARVEPRSSAWTASTA